MLYPTIRINENESIYGAGKKNLLWGTSLRHPLLPHMGFTSLPLGHDRKQALRDIDR